MRVTINDLLKDIPTPELPVPALSPRRQERIQQMTMKKITSQRTQHHRHPLRTAMIAGAAAVLLCGSAFAAYEWDLFDFRSLFGDGAEVLEEHITTFQPQNQTPADAHGGTASALRATAEDYHFTLVGTPAVSDTLIYAQLDVSKTDASAPDFSDSGLTLEIEGYPSSSYALLEGENARIVVYARLDSAQKPDSLTFSLWGGDTASTILEDTPVEQLTARTADFTGMDGENADYVLDSATATDTSLRVTGHFRDGADQSSLDASGTFYAGDGETGYPAPLYDKAIDQFDLSQQQEDVEGYLITRELGVGGSFTLEWLFTKPYSGASTLRFGGLAYSLPQPEDTASTAQPEAAASASTVMDTQDYRFSLESMTAVPNGIYAIVDAEPLTEYGKAHLDALGNSLLLSDVTHTAGGTLGSQLIESGDDMVRILVWNVTDDAGSIQSGDPIGFEVTVMEDGDTAPHTYSLWSAPLDDLLTDSVSLTGSGGYYTVVLTPLTLHLERTIDLGLSPDADNTQYAEKMEQLGAMETPEITITLTDGSSYPILDASWQPTENAALGQYGTLALSTSGQEQEDGSAVISHTLLFTQPVQLRDVASVTIDGQIYTVK